jgi:hypothetical protein
MKRRYYAVDMQFGNAFAVFCFDNRQDRERVVREHERRESVTRAYARKLLARNYLAPGEYDGRVTVGCYRGSRLPWLDEQRKAEAEQLTNEYRERMPGLDHELVRLA